MPYYKCQKCGGRATYKGTELVSGSKVGGAIIGPENDLGFSPVVGVGGGTSVSEETVVKCKKCDCLLGEKDLWLTETEVRSRELDSKTGKKVLLILWAVLVLGSMLFMLFLRLLNN